MLISIIMSVYKENLELVKMSVQSILQQTITTFEYIIVVDNPENKEVIDYLNKISLEDQRVIVLVNDSNIGLPRSLNRGLDIAKGIYIARMDADDVSMCNRLEVSLKYLIDKELDLVGGVYENIDMKGNLIANSMTNGYDSITTSRLLAFTDVVPHPTWFGKREVFDELNGYRNIECAEDYDFLLRALLLEKKIAVMPCKVLNYRINEFGISQSNRYKQFLVSCYLSKNRKKIGRIMPDTVNKNAVKMMNNKKANNYYKAITYFEKAREMKCFKRLYLIICAYFISNDFKRVFLNIIRKRIICIFNEKNDFKSVST